MQSKNNLGSQKLIKGEIQAVHLAHLPSVERQLRLWFRAALL